MPLSLALMHFSKINIIWLSLIRVTDWLNTVTWLKHNSVCSPPQSCGGGTLIDTTKMYSLGENFSRKQMAKWARDTIVSKMYVDRPWSRAGCLLRTQYTRYALHCAQENPRCAELCEFLWYFDEYFMQWQGNGEPYNITDGDFVVGNITECS